MKIKIFIIALITLVYGCVQKSNRQNDTNSFDTASSELLSAQDLSEQFTIDSLGIEQLLKSWSDLYKASSESYNRSNYADNHFSDIINAEYQKDIKKSQAYVDSIILSNFELIGTNQIFDNQQFAFIISFYIFRSNYESDNLSLGMLLDKNFKHNPDNYINLIRIMQKCRPADYDTFMHHLNNSLFIGWYENNIDKLEENYEINTDSIYTNSKLREFFYKEHKYIISLTE